VSGLTCREFVEMVTAFLDHALDAEANRRFVAHLPTCAGCDRYLDQVRQAIRELQDLPAEHLPAGARSAVLAALRGSPT
jgi:anti-sigma factor RsiW